MKSTLELIHAKGTQFFRGCYHACWVEVFVEDENACKTVWVFHDSKIRGRESAISRHCWDFQDREWSLRPIIRRINSLTLSCFYIFAICSIYHCARQGNQKKIVVWSQFNALANVTRFWVLWFLEETWSWFVFDTIRFVEIYFVHALALISKAMRSFFRVPLR